MMGIIAYYFACCSVQLVLVYNFKKIVDTEKKAHWNYTILILIFGIIMSLENYYKLSELHTLSSLIIYFILFYLIFRESKKKTLFYGCAVWFIAAIIDLITMFRSNWISLKFINSDLLLVQAIDTFLLEIIVMLVFKLKKLKKFLHKLYEKIQNNKFPYVKVTLIISIIYVLGTIILSLLKQENIYNIDKYIYLLAILIVSLIIVYVRKEYDYYAINETNKYLIQNSEFYIGVVNNYKVFKHNIKHQLNGVKSVANKEAALLIDDLIKEYNSDSLSNNEISTMPVGIDGLVYEKIYNFKEKEIRLRIDNKIESDIFKNITARSYNLLCESLGILLDNALEASDKSKEKIIVLDMVENKETYQIKIINTFTETLDIDLLGNLKYTTKKGGHGIGLFYLLSKKKIKIKTSIINNLFQNELIIYKNKKTIWS